MSGTSLKLPKMSLFSKKKTNNFLLDHMIELLLVAIIIVLSFVEPAFLRPSSSRQNGRTRPMPTKPNQNGTA